MKKTKQTITVGVPAFNEEENIQRLLTAILAQKGDFLLEKIIVVSDGSTDATPDIVRNMSKKNKKITLQYDKKRTGKANRLNGLFRQNTSDFIVIFDADILIPSTDVIQNMLNKFHNESIVLVSANNLPTPGENFWGKVTQYSEELWYHARKFYNNGESYYNNSGCSFAVKKSFATSLSIPKNSVHNQLYIYFAVAKSKKQFRFAADALVYYKTPSTWKDIIAHHKRGKTSPAIEKKINAILGREEHVPSALRWYALITMLQKNLLYTLFTIVYLRIMSLLPIAADPLNKKGLWTITTSTKRKFV